MPDSTFILLMDQILGYRRDFHRRASADALFPFNDIDAIVAQFVLSRLTIHTVECAQAGVSDFFRGVSLPDGSAPAVLPLGDCNLPGPGAPFNVLTLCTPAVGGTSGAAAKLPPASTLILCYGLHSPIASEFVQLWSALPFAAPEAFVLPLFGQAPGLWRAASCLVCHASQRALLSDTLRPLLAAFACADLDPLRLAEENAYLREKVTHLADHSANVAKKAKLEEEIKKLTRENASLRQTLLQQERTIATMNMNDRQRAASPVAKG